ncbi:MULTISPECIES: PilZ domain-containing protein [Shewanella]|uniref:Cyclic diguanosine monophosphate-binding protein n=1 Tax=Shewanella marisflavi TaxID=260364 RepID=A0AAC9XMX7_9GAMM|nr:MULTISPECIES: PilZ domain-containing protein [Shewanella]ASJ96054.1 PilZ domain-containing protein [Shewanella marisflavi]MCL1043204.1 PilZ domain-containing protein [Shewanella marisflavi]QDF74584.1 PilZ domain-containing protein [Shewanella marisflavi]
MDERRQFSRIFFDVNATLTQEDKVWSTKLHDLSLNGALVEQPQDFAPSPGPLQLSFTLDGSDVEVTMETQLIHQQGGQLGLECSHIDIDSISHLRRMLELNIGDASLLDRELKMFIEVHDQG